MEESSTRAGQCSADLSCSGLKTTDVFKPELRPRTQNYFLRRWRVCLEAIAKEQVPFYAAYSWASEDGTFPGVDAFYDEDISDKLSVYRSATAKPCSGSRHFFSRFRDRSTTSCHKVIFWMGTTYDLAYLGNPIKFWTSINLLVKTHPLTPFIYISYWPSFWLTFLVNYNWHCSFGSFV